MDLMALMTGFGLAAAAGGRACLVLAALGAFHYTPYFELGPSFQWVASPVVICVAAVLAIVEIVADSHPELAEVVALASYLPKFVVGFIALSAATGDVDASLLQLGASGVVGGGTASAVHYVRSRVRETVHDFSADLESVNSGYSWIESGGVLALTGASVLVPVIGVAVIALLVIGGVWASRRMGRGVDAAVDAEVRSRGSTDGTSGSGT
jgi:hypothetical protein